MPILQKKICAARDRRAVPRFSIDAPIQWRVRETPPGPWTDGQLIDLSVAGAAYATSIKLEASTAVTLKIPASAFRRSDSESSQQSIQISGKITTVSGKVVNELPLDNGEWRYGVHFDRLVYIFASQLQNFSQ